jgi:cell division protein FtsI (penicillin-binding protein 3)
MDTARTTPSAATPRSAGVCAPRALAAGACMALAFLAVSAQLVRLAAMGQSEARAALTRPLAENFARPDIVDRHGRLLATDVAAPTLYADSSLILDADEVIERLTKILPDLEAEELRPALSDRSRRFVRLRRGLAPTTAQRIHDLGLPGLYFRDEPKRVYPAGALAGHVLGQVSADNKGLSGIERYIDGTLDGVEPGAAASQNAPVRLSLDLGAQHSLEAELTSAVTRHQAQGAAGVVMDAATGEVLAAASIPEVDPAHPAQSLDDAHLDKLAIGTYELGSVFKAMTIAMALEAGTATPDKVYDVRATLHAGPHVIRDLHPPGRPLSVREIFIFSSNVGAGLMALELGAERQRVFLARLGLVDAIRTEAGPITTPNLPAVWGQAETITIAYGHGLAVAPLQFAAAAAALVNGGFRISPTFVAAAPATTTRPLGVLRPQTSAAMRELLRSNVTSPYGTGRQADVPGYEVGGKTGTAEMPGQGGYRQNAVISSFLASFPISAPRYVVLIVLYEPRPTAETKGQITAGVNAAPTAGRLIARVAPILGVIPKAKPVAQARR